MNKGIELRELAQKVKDESEHKVDLIVDTGSLRLQPDGKTLVLNDNDTVEQFGINEHATGQIAAKVDIPSRYYRKMRDEAPALLADNVNHWFQTQPERRMMRTLNEPDNNHVRAFLSDSYRRVDNDIVFSAILKSFDNTVQPLTVVSSNLTETNMYIKAVFPNLEGEAKVGSPVRMGVYIGNSEIGLGRRVVLPYMETLVCTNGMVSQHNAKTRIRKNHRGKKQDIGDNNMMALSSTATDDAYMVYMFEEMSDLFRAISDQTVFEDMLTELRGATEGTQAKNPEKAVERLAKTFLLSDNERGSVLENFIRDGDYSRYGMLNAVTRVGNTTDSYDRSTELELLGGNILALPNNQWESIALAA